MSRDILVMRRIAKTILDKENLAKAKEDLTKEKT